MKMLNMGHIMEAVAQGHLVERFGNATKSKHQAYYDYHVDNNGDSLLVEVKWCSVPYKSMSINFRWGQIRQLFNFGNFLVYAMSEKGNVYITPDEILQFAHVHYNQLNPWDHRLYLRVALENGSFKPVHPTNCQFCLGNVQEYFSRNTTVKRGRKCTKTATIGTGETKNANGSATYATRSNPCL